MFLNNERSDDPAKISEFFADYYESVYEDPFDYDERNFQHLMRDCVDIQKFNISFDDLVTQLKALDPNKGSGPDGIPPVFLRNTGPTIAIPLMTIFTQSLTSGIFPHVWKSSFITSIYKSGDRSNISNYRGIAILSAIPKLFEKLITDFLYLSTKANIIILQHGFLKGSNTVF